MDITLVFHRSLTCCDIDTTEEKWVKPVKVSYTQGSNSIQISWTTEQKAGRRARTGLSRRKQALGAKGGSKQEIGTTQSKVRS